MIVHDGSPQKQGLSGISTSNSKSLAFIILREANDCPRRLSTKAGLIGHLHFKFKIIGFYHLERSE
jgi:hypothetical protein